MHSCGLNPPWMAYIFESNMLYMLIKRPVACVSRRQRFVLLTLIASFSLSFFTYIHSHTPHSSFLPVLCFHQMASVPHSQAFFCFMGAFSNPRSSFPFLHFLPFPEMTLSDFETSLSPLALALPFVCHLSVSLLQGPHRWMVCVRLVRAGWPACCEKWWVTAALFRRHGT